MLRAVALAGLLAPLLYAQTGGSAEGTVTNAVTHAPIAGVSVTLWTPQAVRYYATTDNSGAWRITEMQPGRYRSRYEKDGFFEPPRDGPGLDPMVAVGPGGNPARLDAQLTPLATVRGRVLDPEGNPVPDVEVSFLRYANTVKTDSDGRFVLPEVRPGSYQLQAKPQRPEPEPSKGERTEIVPTYYPSAIDRAEATTITIRGGDDLPGFDIRLRTASVYRLRGTVLDADGNRLPNAAVRLLSTSPAETLSGQMSFGAVRYFFRIPVSQTQEATTVSNAKGEFEFSSIHSGEWLLNAEAEPKRDEDRNLVLRRSDTVPVTLSDRDLDEVQIRFPQAFNLDVHLDYGERPPLDAGPGFPPPAILYPAEGGSGFPSMPSRSKGVLSFTNLVPGLYRVIPLSGTPPGYYPASVRLAGQEVLGQTIQLNPGSPPLQIVFKPNAGSIRGIVDHGEGATVLLWPQSNSGLNMFRAVQAGSGGVFEIGSLPPDSYKVLAVDTQSPDKLSEVFLQTSGVSVQVDESASPSVSLPLTHVP